MDQGWVSEDSGTPLTLSRTAPEQGQRGPEQVQSRRPSALRRSEQGRGLEQGQGLEQGARPPSRGEAVRAGFHRPSLLYAFSFQQRCG